MTSEDKLRGHWLFVLLAMSMMTGCESRRAGSPSAEAGPKPAVAPEAVEASSEPTPGTPASGPEILAKLGDATLPRDTPASAIPGLLPGVEVEPAPDHGGHALLAADGTLLAWYAGGDHMCFKAPGLTDPHGVAVGARLSTIPNRAEMACEIATGDDLLHLGDICPGELADEAMLVCELGSPFRRLFFAVDPKHANHAGDELRGPELEVFADAELRAMLLLAGVEEPEPAKEPEAATVEPPADAAILAQVPGQPKQLVRAGTPATIAAIEAALPGFSVKRRRHFGLHVYRGSTRVASVMEEVGKPFNRITLEAPGLADRHGIEVGVSTSALAKIPLLTCAFEGDEEWDAYVVCTAEGKPAIRYIFIHDFDAERFGETLTLAEAEALLGETKLAAIEIAVW